MKEYDLPLKEECPRCCGHGFLVIANGVVPPYDQFCDVCKGKGYLELGKLELEKKND